MKVFEKMKKFKKEKRDFLWFFNKKKKGERKEKFGRNKLKIIQEILKKEKENSHSFEKKKKK